MNVVFFGEELNARAPLVVGCLYKEDGGEWVSLLDIVAAMRMGESVQIRQALKGV